MTPDLPTSPPQPRDPGGVSRELVLWLGRLLVWGAAIIAALVVGGPLALFGLSGVVLAVAVAIIAIGALAWRRAMLPLALIAGAFAVPAALVAVQPERIDRSQGLLQATPRSVADIPDLYRRGRGNVIVDLRKLTAAPKSVIDIAARSDNGRVVVALPIDRCFNLEVKTRALQVDRTTLTDLALVPGIAAGLVPDSNGVGDYSGVYTAEDAVATPGPLTNLVAYGRSAPADASTDDRWIAASGTWKRGVYEPGAPTLRLDLTAATNTYVRDFPPGVGIATDRADAYASNEFPNLQQVSDVHWPDQVELPPSPEQLNADDAYGEPGRTDWHLKRQRILWSRWLRQVVPAAISQGRRAAGTCATDAARSSYWTRVNYGTGKNARELAVSGNGRVRYSVARDDTASELVTRFDSTSTKFLSRYAGAKTTGGRTS